MGTSCDSSNGRVAASYPADLGSNLIVSGSNEIALSSKYNPYYMVISYYALASYTLYNSTELVQNTIPDQSFRYLIQQTNGEPTKAR